MKKLDSTTRLARKCSRFRKKLHCKGDNRNSREKYSREKYYCNNLYFLRCHNVH